MSGRGIKIAIEITKEIVPLIVDLLQEIESAKAAKSEGGHRITKNERQRIAIEMSLTIVPRLHDIFIDILKREA
tara:strand:- start:121 stop:342 length:222 start_codon:yes stop_codon:yes gene_type:complete